MMDAPSVTLSFLGKSGIPATRRRQRDSPLAESSQAMPVPYRLDDAKCGTSAAGVISVAPDGTRPAQCNPKGTSPCCSKFGFCGSSDDHCLCDGCADYRTPGSSTASDSYRPPTSEPPPASRSAAVAPRPTPSQQAPAARPSSPSGSLSSVSEDPLPPLLPLGESGASDIELGNVPALEPLPWDVPTLPTVKPLDPYSGPDRALENPRAPYKPLAPLFPVRDRERVSISPGKVGGAPRSMGPTFRVLPPPAGVRATDGRATSNRASLGRAPYTSPERAAYKPPAEPAEDVSLTIGGEEESSRKMERGDGILEPPLDPLAKAGASTAAAAARERSRARARARASSPPPELTGFVPYRTAAPCTRPECSPIPSVCDANLRERVCSDECGAGTRGSCDDGAIGATASLCAFGTDCADCGERCCEDDLRWRASEGPWERNCLWYREHDAGCSSSADIGQHGACPATCGKCEVEVPHEDTLKQHGYRRQMPSQSVLAIGVGVGLAFGIAWVLARRKARRPRVAMRRSQVQVEVID